MPLLNPSHLAPPPRKSREYTREYAFESVGIAPAVAQSRPSSPSAAFGTRYEARVGQRLSSLASSLGFDLWDHQRLVVGSSVAEPDFVMVSASGAAILFEVKYTWEDTRNQLKFYSDILLALGLYSVVSVTICRNLVPDAPPPIFDFLDIEEGSTWQMWM